MADLYRVMLVDDEEDVRQAVIRKLDWESLGFEVVGEASNGEEALEMAERLEPDVIMTDIRMPFMDGLELCRRVKRQLPGTRMAILSGFDEFEYAREAICQQVEDYILKPIDAAEMARIFERIRASLDAEIAEARDMEKLRQHYENSLPMLRQQALLSLLSGRLLTDSQEAAALGLDLRGDAYCAAALRYDSDGGDTRLLSISLEQTVQDMLSSAWRYHFVLTPNRAALLFMLDAGKDVRDVAVAVGQLLSFCRKRLGVRLHGGLGKVYKSAEGWARSFEEASGALEYRALIEPGQCLYIGDVEPGAGVSAGMAPDTRLAEALLRQIKIGTAEELAAAVEALMQELRGPGTNPQHHQVYLLEVFTGLLKLMRTYRLDEREARLDSLLQDAMGMRFDSLDELSDWLLSFCENLRMLARQERKDSMRLLIDKAKEILADRYADSELSLEGVCGELNVSVAYFSTLFKKETGQGFVGYLTDLRMERALELLSNTDEKTYQIAGRIGYSDPNYFSYVFKKRFGVSPSKYRQARVEQHAEA